MADLHPPHTKETAVESSYPSSVNSVSKSADPSVMAPATAHAEPKTTMDNKEIALVDEKSEAVFPSSDLEEDTAEYPKGWKLGLISVALCLAVFCMALDNTIIATAIPRITDHFHALDDVGWYVSVYLLTTCSFQLIFGKLYTFYSIKWVFLSALLVFEVGSVVCATAPTSNALIVGRAIAGVGSAGIFSGAILIVTYTVPLSQRPLYTGFIGGMYGIASVAGPLMGGAFTDNPKLTWRWCFYINLPFGLVTAVFIFIFFKSPKRAKIQSTIIQQLDAMDLPGTIVFLPGVVCLLLALQWGGTKYTWGSGRIIALLVVSALLIITFVVLQFFRGEKATVPPRVFKNRNIWSTAVFAAFLGGSFFVMMFYLPIWFQAIKGASAVKSGIMSLPFILGMVIFSIIAGGVITTTGYYTPFMYLSAVLIPIGAGLLSTLQPDSGHAKWIGYQAIFGFGTGAGFQQPLLAAQACLPLADIPIGTAIMMFSQILGGAIIASVGQNVFTNQLVQNLIKSVPGINPSIVLAAGATELKRDVPSQFYNDVLIAYNKAIDQTFYVSVAMGALCAFPLIFVQWKSVKGKQISTAAV
ncbi:MFS general substrate transporter [Microthyrium microscopicum]|uniref:MFS general substrate transporter n=1 Tax=Microthyrium microscopicum TaxID=703497 RepID=A0A6A6TSS7_9PEZI|nr:MFS general substrate transporter [Microthyrium microscopicum]